MNRNPSHCVLSYGTDGSLNHHLLPCLLIQLHQRNHVSMKTNKKIHNNLSQEYICQFIHDIKMPKDASVARACDVFMEKKLKKCTVKYLSV